MAEFQTTSGTANCIEQIVLKATKKLVIVTPYLKLSKTFSERLMDASSKGVSIKLIYGKSELNEKQKELLAKLENLELYFFENLHAKCYFNEKSMVITSMNLYESSEKNNREMGISIDRVVDKEIFENAMNETHSILKAAKKEELHFDNGRSKNVSKINTKSILSTVVESKNAMIINPKLNAYCIRCGDPIKKKPERPFCKECGNSWNTFGNWDYEEKYCHTCGGKATDISMGKPLCYDCFMAGKWADGNSRNGSSRNTM
jgi:hypothetical protein